MSEPHLAYLNLGSNIQPEANLPKAVELLSKVGEILKISRVWESEAIGADGQNYLNACLSFRCTAALIELKEKIIDPIESALGRVRGEDKFAPRTIDIDIILFDDEPLDYNNWTLPFIVIPLADIYPDFKVPENGELITETATRLRKKFWMEARQGIFG